MWIEQAITGQGEENQCMHSKLGYALYGVRDSWRTQNTVNNSLLHKQKSNNRKHVGLLYKQSLWQAKLTNMLDFESQIWLRSTVEHNQNVIWVQSNKALSVSQFPLLTWSINHCGLERYCIWYPYSSDWRIYHKKKKVYAAARLILF